MNRNFCLALALATIASMSFAEESASTAMLRGSDGPVVEILGSAGQPLGRMISPGWSVALSEGRPQINQISENQVLVLWYGTGGTAVSIVESSGGKLHEVWSDAFEPGWTIAPARDFNKDGHPDFLILKRTGDGDNTSFACAIALWDKDKGIDLVTDPATVVPRCRGAYFASGDVDGDGAADVVFHSFDYGGSYQTNLYMLKGHGDGTFDPEPQKRLLLTSPFAASNPVLDDFDGDGDLDVFLPPDDDVDDEGQSHIAFNDGTGTMENLKESIDFSPANEGGSGDNFIANAATADIDHDGKLDLVAYCNFIPEKAYEVRTYRGLGGGEFAAESKVLAAGEYAKVTPPSFAWIGWPGRAAETPAVKPVTTEEMDAWWKALAAAKPREVARALRSFSNAGSAALPFLSDHIASGTAVDEKRVNALIKDLDDDDIEVREAATKCLIGMADVAEPLLQAALAKDPSPEVEARIRLIQKSPSPGTLSDLQPEDARLIRLVALLEAIDTPEAREALSRMVQPNASIAVRHAAAEAIRRQKR